MTLPLLIATCPTGFESGGLGQHLARIHEDALAAGYRARVLCHGGSPKVDIVSGAWEQSWFRWPPFRWRPDLRVWWRHERFDREVARRLEPCDTFVGFMGGALRSFYRARSLGARKLVLEMPNSHPANVVALHALAGRRHGWERSWMSGIFASKALREFEMADEIRTNSDYTTRSLVERGIDPAKIVRRRLGCHPRFSSLSRTPHLDGLRVVVCVGSLSVPKGIPFLVEAFRHVPGPDLRLLLVGGWSTRRMANWLRKARRIDPRISWTSGDPAPHFATATAAVHPSYEDGWGYAPAEALASGLPVAASDQTGMMEILDRSARQSVLPVDDFDAWVAWMRSILGEGST